MAEVILLHCYIWEPDKEETTEMCNIYQGDQINQVYQETK